MTPQRVERSYLAISGLYTLSASLIWGVNTLFLLDAGLSIFQVFLANAVFAGSMAFFEIPTGVLADARGRRISFLASTIVVLIGTLGYVAGGIWQLGLLWFCAMSVVLGLGYTFYSGAVEAWVVDALHASGFRGNLDRVFARGAMVSGAAMLIGTVGGGVLGGIHLALPYITRAVLLGLLFLFSSWTMHDIGFEPRGTTWRRLPSDMGQIARASVTYGWRNGRVRLLMICSSLQSGFLMWAFYAWQPYLLELLGRDAVWVAGVVAALISLATIVGNGAVTWIPRFCVKRTTILLGSAIFATLAAVGIGLAGSFSLALGLLLVLMAAVGASGPVKQAFLHQLVPSEQRATVISFDSMIGNGGGVIGQSALGAVSQSMSIGSGYVIGGAATALIWPVLALLRRIAGPEDRIEPSTKIPKRRSCPPPDHPAG